MARAYFQVYFSHAGRNGTHGKGFRTKKEREDGLNIGGSLLGTIPRGHALWGNSLPDTYARPTEKKNSRNGINVIFGRSSHR